MLRVKSGTEAVLSRGDGRAIYYDKAGEDWVVQDGEKSRLVA